MKKDSFKLIIMSVAVICIVIAGIMVPGIVLEANQKSNMIMWRRFLKAICLHAQ